MTRRIAFLDIDGTIIDHNGEIPESTIRAIREARSNGHLVYLASGRTPTEVEPRLIDIGFDGAILGAGAYVWVGELWAAGGWSIERLLTEADAAEMIAGYRDVGAEFILQGREDVWATQGGYNRLAAGLEAEGRLSEATRAALLDHITVTDVPPVTGIAKSVFSGTRRSASAWASVSTSSPARCPVSAPRAARFRPPA